MARTLLFLSADKFFATVWKGGKLSAPTYFSSDTNGRGQFTAFLRNNPHPAYLLVDVIEEDFRVEVVPHLIGSARKELLERKYEQFYRGTPFRQANLIQRLSEGRRDDELLFSALTNPARISPWLDTLHASHTPLVGIYSLPNISTPLLKEITADHVLLLSWERDAGLRQTYYNNKRLHFSRLIPINGNSSFAEAVANETPRTLQYLKSLSLPPAGEVLEVHILCHPNEVATLQGKLGGDNEVHYAYVDLLALARKHKCKSQLIDSDATPLFLSLLASKPPRCNYANAEHSHFYTLWQLRYVLFGLAATLTLSSTLWSGIDIWQGQELSDETAPVQAQTAKVQQQTQDILRSFGNTTVPAADMKSAVLLTRKLVQYAPPPQTIVQELSQALTEFSQIKVNRLEWKVSPGDAGASPYPAQLVTLEGELTEFGTNYRETLDYLDRFQQSLTQRGYTITDKTLPLDITSKGSISGDLQQAENKPTQFTLKFIWRQAE